MTVRPINDDALWDSFVSSSPQGTVFSTSAWIRAAAAIQGGEPRFLGVFEDDRLAGGVTFIELSRGPFKKMTTPVLTPYGGVVYRPVSGKRSTGEESFTTTCAEQLIGNLGGWYSYSCLVHAPGLIDIRPFTWAGWRGSVRYTYVVDLTDTGRVWDLMERRVRTVLRKAESTLGLGGAVDMEQFGGLYDRIYRDRGKKPPIPRNIVTAFVDTMMKTGLAEMRSVRDETGEIISVIVLVSGSGTVYAWISGSVPDKNSTGAFSLLFWDAIRRYSETSTRLDMVGANIPSVAFFKKGFGGELKPYYVTERYGSLLARAVFGAYGGMKRIFSP